MAECIVVTSGKGGVGKTTTSANLGAALALSGKKVAVVDADIGLRNLDERALEHGVPLESIIRDPCGLRRPTCRPKSHA